MALMNEYHGVEPRVVALVRHHAGRLAAADRRLEREDLEQELLLHLHVRANRFDARRGSFATFADRVVRNRAAVLGRDARAAIRGAAATTVSFDDLLAGDDGFEAVGESGEGLGRFGLPSETATPWEELAGLRCDLARFLSGLPRRLRECCLLLRDHSAGESARALGRHRSTIYVRLALLRARGRAVGLDVYVRSAPTDSTSAG
jgi:RNA polymerase sigma-70 factor (ECF subfamily)